MLEIKEVSKSFGTALVLDRVSFKVDQGSFFAILGPSGSGKTTLLTIIAGLLEPASGEVFWKGAGLAGLPAHQRGFSFVFQNYALLPHWTVLENVAFPLVARQYNHSRSLWVKAACLVRSLASLLTAEHRAQVRETLELVRLSGFDQRRVQTLSGGQAQRVALARALVTRPDLLLMDEPLANLDRHLKLTMRRELKSLQRQTQVTVVYVTHDQEEAVTLADRMALLRQGRLEQAGSSAEILHEPASDWVRDFFNPKSIVDPEVARLVAASQ